MDLEGLERIFRDEHPKMMILCNPHNPVGIQWSVEVLQEVARLAKKYGVTVVSDEIHADLMLYGKPHFPFPSVDNPGSPLQDIQHRRPCKLMVRGEESQATRTLLPLAHGE